MGSSHAAFAGLWRSASLSLVRSAEQTPVAAGVADVADPGRRAGGREWGGRRGPGSGRRLVRHRTNRRTVRKEEECGVACMTYISGVASWSVAQIKLCNLCCMGSCSGIFFLSFWTVDSGVLWQRAEGIHPVLESAEMVDSRRLRLCQQFKTVFSCRLAPCLDSQFCSCLHPASLHTRQAGRRCDASAVGRQ